MHCSGARTSQGGCSVPARNMPKKRNAFRSSHNTKSFRRPGHSYLFKCTRVFPERHSIQLLITINSSTRVHQQVLPQAHCVCSTFEPRRRTSSASRTALTVRQNVLSHRQDAYGSRTVSQQGVRSHTQPWAIHSSKDILLHTDEGTPYVQ
jgi:hypothetical protein